MKHNTSRLLIAVLVVVGVLAAAIMTRGEATGPQITQIDGKTPNTTGEILDPISQTPSFSGTAPANSLVSIYRQAPGSGSEELVQAAGESDLLITQVTPSEYFIDDFSGNYQDHWYSTSSSVAQVNGALEITTNPGDFLNSNGIFSASSYALSNGGWTVTIDATTPPGYTPSGGGSAPEGLQMRFGVNAVSSSNQEVGNFELQWSTSTGEATLASTAASLPSNTAVVPFTPGSHQLTLTYDGSQLSAQIDGQAAAQVSIVLPNNVVRISPYFSVPAADAVTVTVDNFTSNLLEDAAISMSRMGMAYLGTPYMDPAPFFDNPEIPGVLLWSNDAEAIQLPSDEIASFPFTTDVYVYLSTLTIPAGAFGNNPELHLRWTNYASTPDVFSQIVYFLNTQVGLPFQVDAYAKIATQSGGTITPISTPVSTIGRIGNQGQLLPPLSNLRLIAKARAGAGGNWTTQFGKDENGSAIPELSDLNLAAIGESPYTFVVHADTGSEIIESVLSVTASTISETTDTIAPTSSVLVTGTQQPAPYQNFYTDQATVTLSATDNEGGSGVERIEYSLSGAINRATTEYTEPIVITVTGETTITFHAVDVAGNGEVAQTRIIRIDKDTDGDGVYDNFDGCVLTYGSPELNGCALAIRLDGQLRVHYTTKASGYAGIEDGKEKPEVRIPLALGPVGDSRNEEITSVQARVFEAKTITAALGKNLTKSLKQSCDIIFDQAPAVGSQTIATGNEYIGVTAKQDYVVAVRTVVSEPGSQQPLVATACQEVKGNSFMWTAPSEGTQLEKAKGNSGTVSFPSIKFTKTVKTPRAILTADEGQGS